MPKKNKRTAAEIDKEFYKISTKVASGAPRFWFEFMEWLIIIGALEYVRERTNHVVIYICLGISVFSLVAFIQVPIQIFVQKKYKKGLGKVLAYIFAFILIFIIYKFIYVVVEDLSALNIK